MFWEAIRDTWPGNGKTPVTEFVSVDERSRRWGPSETKCMSSGQTVTRRQNTPVIIVTEARWLWCFSYPVCVECCLLCRCDGTTHADADARCLYPRCRRVQQGVQHLPAWRHSAVGRHWRRWRRQRKEWQILWQGSLRVFRIFACST